MKTLLEARDLSVGYELRHKSPIVVSGGITLSIEKGEFICLLGPNGAGKSTLLRTLAGQQQALAGSIYLQQQKMEDIPKSDLAKVVSVVLTERITTSLLTVYDLVALGRTPFTGWSSELSGHDHEIVENALTFTGAQELARKRLSELSDGERQRCMLARALAQEPALLILDEITAFLDLPRRIEMMHKLQQLAHDRGIAIVLSTHDLDLALGNADRVLLQPKGGKLIDAGPEDMVLSGAFERAFESEGLIFDKHSGSFNRPRTIRGLVSVLAEGVEAYWVQRALERKGFLCVTKDDPEAAIVIQRDADRWMVTHRDRQDELESITAVVKVLTGKE
jgi:iron complex transport system ATP-binding protein